MFKKVLASVLSASLAFSMVVAPATAQGVETASTPNAKSAVETINKAEGLDSLSNGKVGEKPVITKTKLKPGREGVFYEDFLEAKSDTPIINWSGDNLPEGLTVDSDTGRVSGTVNIYGALRFAVTATNAAGYSATATILLCMSSATAPDIINEKLKNGFIEKEYADQLELDDTVSIVMWDASGLPEGLTIDSSTGKVSGTPKTVGKYNPLIIVMTEKGRTYKNLPIEIKDDVDKPVILTDSLANGKVNQRYDVNIEANRDVVWTITGLPEGLSYSNYNTNICRLFGTPTKAGEYNLEVKAQIYGTDIFVTKNLTLIIEDDIKEPVITTETFDDGFVSKEYKFQVELKNEVPVQWSAKHLPEGLEIDEETGIVSGTPKVAGSYKPIIATQNQFGGMAKEIPIEIKNSVEKPVITTDSVLKEGKIGQAYEFKLEATVKETLAKAASESDFLKWSIEGSLPEGLSLNFETGIISGTPIKAGDFKFNAVATNSVGSDQKEMSLKINDNVVKPEDDNKKDNNNKDNKSDSKKEATLTNANNAKTGDNSFANISLLFTIILGAISAFVLKKRKATK